MEIKVDYSTYHKSIVPLDIIVISNDKMQFIKLVIPDIISRSTEKYILENKNLEKLSDIMDKYRYSHKLIWYPLINNPFLYHHDVLMDKIQKIQNIDESGIIEIYQKLGIMDEHFSTQDILDQSKLLRIVRPPITLN